MAPEAANRLAGLDHLRATAILLVFLFHYHLYYGLPDALLIPGVRQIVSFGWSGVDLFFVLSGYLIGDMLLRDVDRAGRVRIASFTMNRGLRILPAYFATVALYFSVPEFREGRALQPLLKFLTFTQNSPIDLSANTFSHAWSLCVEVHFYLLLPVALVLLVYADKVRYGVYVLASLVILGLLIRYLDWASFVEPAVGRERMRAAFTHIYYPTNTRLDGLLVGVAIACLFRYRQDLMTRITRHGNTLFLAGMAILTGAYLLFDGFILSRQFTTLTTTVIGFPVLALGYGLLVVSALSPGSFLHGTRLRATATLAALAYSICLVHKITNHLSNSFLTVSLEMSGMQAFLVSVLLTLAAGAALHLAIEKPFMKLRGSLASKSR